MSMGFEIESYPYEFIHKNSNNISFEITFKKELDSNPLIHFTDYEIMRNAFYGWYNRYVTLIEKTIRNVNDKEYQDKMQDIINIIPGIVSHVSFENLNIEWETLYEMLKWLNSVFNFTHSTKNKVLSVKIYGDLSKIIKQEQPQKGFVRNFTYTVNYTKTDDDKTKFIFTADDVIDIRNNDPFESILLNWHMSNVDFHYTPSQFEKKCKIKAEENKYIFTMPNYGINTKNLLLLLHRLEYDYSKKLFKSLDIFSNELPTLEYMRSSVDEILQK